MSSKNKLETWGNETTMNLNNLVYSNILTSPYFKALMEKTTYQELVDEIYYHVKYLDPFLKGSAPSSAFCILYRCWLVKFTVNQLSEMVEHPDSPYIRAIGFLYLRYVCKPANLMEWFEPFFEDEEEIQLSKASSQKTTIGELCRQLLVDQKFLGTILPRIPVLVQKDIDAKIQPKPPSPKYKKDRSVYDKRDDRDDSRRSRDYDRDYRSSRRDGSRDYDRHRDRRHRHDSRDRDYRRRSPSPRRHNRDRDYDRGRDKYRDDRSGRSHHRDSKRSYSRSRSPRN